MNTKIIAWILLLFVLLGSASAAIKTIHDEDDEKTYIAEDISYTINAIYIGDGKVKFRVNDETTSKLSYHETYKFEEGSIIFVREILEEEILEGPDKVIFNFYPAKCADCIFEITDAEQEDKQEMVEEKQEKEQDEEDEEQEEGEQEDKLDKEEQEEEIDQEEELDKEEQGREQDKEQDGEQGKELDKGEIEEIKKSFLKRLYSWFLKWFIWWVD
ncbi:hypothetical protein KY317_00800 [Candidatus Woesearchaeota archaeon]|nr:hypothetical protein [Candidatus Woesearchaeota archaeon]